MNHKLFTKLYTQYFPGLIKAARYGGLDQAMAEDIVQQVFLKLLEREDDLHEIRNWKNYLYVLMRNETVNYLRRHQYHAKLLKYLQRHSQHATLHDALLEKEYRNILQAAIEKLPKQQRLVYQLRVEYKFRNKQVAKELNLSIETVKKHIKLARQKLEKLVA